MHSDYIFVTFSGQCNLKMILRVKASLCPAIFGDWYKLIEAYLVEAKLSIAFDPWNETPTGNPFCESYTV